MDALYCVIKLKYCGFVKTKACRALYWNKSPFTTNANTR